MSAYHQIFIRTEKTELQLIEDLRRVSNAEIKALDPAHGSIAYGGSKGDTIVEVELTHEFEDDRNLEFSSYPLVVTVRKLNADQSAREQAARAVFDQLKNIGGYELLFVFNLQRLLGQT